MAAPAQTPQDADASGLTPREAIAAMRIRAPTRGNRRLERLLAAVNADDEVKAWWHVASLNATRLGMSDHSWVHIQIVVNIALRLSRLLLKRGVEPAIVSEHGLKPADAEVVIAAAALLHCVGMSVHRADHEAHSLFLAAPKLRELLGAAGYEDPDRAVLASEALGAIIAHRRRGEPLTLEAGIVRVADALDMAEGRSRIPFQTQRPNIHSLSAAAVESVEIKAGRRKAVRIDIAMTNSAGIFQVDELLATKLRGSKLEEHVEVVARIEGEHERRLVPVFEIG
ncbi:MAG: HD domain-containing protein [Solirubrobacteraceae bacterium]